MTAAPCARRPSEYSSGTYTVESAHLATRTPLLTSLSRRGISDCMVQERVSLSREAQNVMYKRQLCRR
ncbi:hypothetical protein RRG08_014658 [Elysia crispata]|uniref:Uncharacterized protein n=1 Tax=Elysia crispata TaxID=231223 RepID=A0AAE0YIJ8_9GAST|nr:hypothetical protein RRG08_014658 [Elysia crispata]